MGRDYKFGLRKFGKGLLYESTFSPSALFLYLSSQAHESTMGMLFAILCAALTSPIWIAGAKNIHYGIKILKDRRYSEVEIKEMDEELKKLDEEIKLYLKTGRY